VPLVLELPDPPDPDSLEEQDEHCWLVALIERLLLWAKSSNLSLFTSIFNLK
jgi:hypothetical protein